jgi:PAS domain S-box-containing protein
MKMNNLKTSLINSIKNAVNYKSIYFKSAMLSWTLIIATVVIFFVGIIPFQKDAAINKMRSECKDIATSVAQVTATAIISEDYSFAVEHCMNVLRGSHSIKSIVITKNDGFSLLHKKEAWNTQILDSTWHNLSEEEKTGNIMKSRFEDSDVFRYSYPLTYSGINWGWIHIENSLDQYNEDFDTIYKRLIALSAVLIALGFILSFYFSSWLVKPIRLVDNVAQSFANGDLTARIDMINVKSSSEIGSLSESFNTMAVNLKAAQQNLESKVEARTKQLVLSNKELEKYKVQLEKLVDDRTNTIKEVNRALVEEIDKLQMAEKEIESQLKFLKTLLGTIPIPIYILDNEMRFTDFNPAFDKHFEKDKTNLIGKSFYSLFTEEDQKDFRLSKKDLFKNGFVTFEKRLNSSSNSKKDLIFFESIFKSASGETSGVVGVILDITQVKESERKIVVALEKEKELAELRTKFFSHASHEFRTPLATILSSVELISMLNPKLSTGDNGNHLDQIFTSVDYMTNLLDDILTINKADTGKFLLNPESMNLFDFVSKLKAEMESNDKYKHHFRLTCNNNESTIIGDKKLLRLIFTNLISNAIKYSPHATPIDISIDQNDSLVKIKIRDEGIGIPPEEQKNLFEPFFRASNSGDVKGTGLGLSLIKKVVEQHNGKISFASTLNKGTEFVVTLPITVEQIIDSEIVE